MKAAAATRPARRREQLADEVAAHLVNLAWNGLSRLDPQPRLTAI